MTIVEILKTKLLEARKTKNELAKNVLSVALGDIQTLEGSKSQNGPVTEGQAEKIVQKMIKSNQETMACFQNRKGEVVNVGGMVELGDQGVRYAVLQAENEILAALLPKTCSKEEIKAHLVQCDFKTKALSMKDGPAVGLAMKELLSLEGSKDGKVVTEIVKELRWEGVF